MTDLRRTYDYSATEKRCTGCNEVKPKTSFDAVSKNHPRRISRCQSCREVYKRQWRTDNPSKVVLETLRHSARTLGFDPDTMETYFREHNGVCDICGQPPEHRDPRSRKPKRLCIDHDHATGKFRGLVCMPCNQALGNMEDNPKWLMQAASYLEKS